MIMYICSSDGKPLSAQCPQCELCDSYRISISHGQSLSVNLFTLCIECSDSKQLQLPYLHKKVVYLDQFFISNVSKGEYKEQQDLIEYLIRNQYAVFPTSIYHNNETHYMSDPKHRNATYGLSIRYACDMRFKHTDEIVEALILNSSGKSTSVDMVLHGDRNSWHCLSDIKSLNLNHNDGSFRTECALRISNWLKRTKLSFEDILNVITKEYSEEFIRIPIKYALEQNNHSIHEQLKNIFMFRIIAALLFALSNKFQKEGRTENIDTGMALDVYMIADVSPYVDAIIIDNYMHRLLNDSKYLSEEYKNRIYSIKGISGKNNLCDFTSFLNNIRENNSFYSCPPFEFTHAQLIDAYYKKSPAPSVFDIITQYNHL